MQVAQDLLCCCFTHSWVQGMLFMVVLGIFFLKPWKRQPSMTSIVRTVKQNRSCLQSDASHLSGTTETLSKLEDWSVVILVVTWGIDDARMHALHQVLQRPVILWCSGRESLFHADKKHVKDPSNHRRYGNCHMATAIASCRIPFRMPATFPNTLGISEDLQLLGELLHCLDCTQYAISVTWEQCVI